MLTANGRIEIGRKRWYSPEEGSDHPVDRLLDASESVVSVGVRELCCRLGIAGGGFERAAENLDKAAQIQVGEESLRQVVESEGKAVQACHRQDQLEIDWSAAELKTAAPDGKPVSRIYISADGVMVPMTTAAEKLKRRATVIKWRREHPAVGRPRLGRVKEGADQGYKQLYVTRFYDQDKDHCLMSVTRKDHKEMGRILRRDAARLRVLAADERVGLVDGATCLRTHMEGQGLRLSGLGLDFHHLAGHVGQAGRDVGEAKKPDPMAESAPTEPGRPEAGRPEAGKGWAADMLHTVRHEGHDPFWEKLVDWRGRQRGQKRKGADGLLNYVAARKEMILYKEFEEKGWDIGSGPIESACKVTTLRIKGPGMRWDGENAEAMMALEALRQSGLWKTYWDKALSHPN